MIELDNFILNLTPSDELMDKIKPEQLSFYDLCRKKNATDEFMGQFAAENCLHDERYCLPEVEEKCQVTPRPLDFIYDRRTDTYDLSQFHTDMDLISRIQSGKGDKTFMFYGHKNLYVELMFAGTIPEVVTQDYTEGYNDLYSAKSARWMYTLDNKPISEGFDRFWS